MISHIQSEFPQDKELLVAYSNRVYIHAKFRENENQNFLVGNVSLLVADSSVYLLALSLLFCVSQQQEC